MNKKKRYTVMALSALLMASAVPHFTFAHTLVAQSAAMSQSAAMAQTMNYKPWSFWYWMYGAVSKAGIHADLVGMKNVGLGGTYLMPIRGVAERPEFKGEARQLSPKFWEMVDYSFQQADSLGLDMGIHICDGFALAGNPSILPEESMQKVVWTDSIVVGGKKIEGMSLLQPESYQDGKLQPIGSNGGYYEDIAAFAIRYQERPQLFKPSKIDLTDGISTKKGYYLASQPSSITYTFDKPVTVRSMMVKPNGNNIQSQRLLVQTSDDGIHFRDVKQLMPPRQGWQNTQRGYTFSLPTTTARYFRFFWTPEGTEPGAEDMDAAKWKPLLKLENIILSNQPMVNQYEGKSGAIWRIDTDASAVSEVVGKEEVIRLQMEGGKIVGALIDGKLVKKLPKGTWRLLRMGHTSTGQTNETAGEGKGLEIDKFSPAAVKKLFDSWYGLFLKRPHADVLKYLHIDSWECGSQNWGYQFAEEFKARRGYDLIPYLPVMAGVPMESAEKYEQVLKDIRLTINDLVNEKFFKTFTTLAQEHNLKVSHESIAPTFPADGLQHYQYADHPMGEYWLNSPTHDKPNDMLDAVSGAHIYGKNIVQAEGFTEVRGVWNETPAMLKPMLDRNLALGMNKLFFHVSAHNPWMDRKPGMTLDGIGLFFQRDNTWYPEARGFVDYITQCQYFLQQGRPVVDIAVFTGEEIPSRSFTPDKLVPMLPGVFGSERVASEQKRIANIGIPMEESPVGVTHSANILDLKDWCNALHGYKYDSMNKDALLRLAHAEKGVITLQQDGKLLAHSPQYRILVVPQKNLSAEVKAKIEELRQAGVVVIDQPYVANDFSQYGLQPDVVLPENMDYAHRKTEDGDIYFLCNQEDKARKVMPVFRGKEQASQWIHFPAYGSALVQITNDGKVSTTNFMIDGGERVQEQILNGEWNVHFDDIQQDTTVCLPFDWSKAENEKMRYYSGHATFTTTFVWKASKGKGGKKKQNVWTDEDYVKICLGKIGDVAKVLVNGKRYGYAWTAPYEVYVPKVALKNGKNTLQIVVANTWHNALQGAAEGKAPFDGIWTNGKYRTKSKALLPAGLLSTIKIVY